MTNTLSFPSPYITLSLLHSLHPQKHLNGTLQGGIREALLLFQKGAIRGALLFCFKRSQKERLLTLEEHSAEPLLFKRSHKEGTTDCFQKRDCFHLKNTLQDHHCFKGVISESITVCSKKSHKRNCFFIKTQSCFHIYSIKTISNGLHILKEVIRRGLFLNQNSAFDLKLPRTLIKVSMQWFIYIQKKGGLQRAIHMLIKFFFF
jgi:hypothetical protein